MTKLVIRFDDDWISMSSLSDSSISSLSLLDFFFFGGIGLGFNLLSGGVCGGDWLLVVVDDMVTTLGFELNWNPWFLVVSMLMMAVWIKMELI